MSRSINIKEVLAEFPVKAGLSLNTRRAYAHDAAIIGEEFAKLGVTALDGLRAGHFVEVKKSLAGRYKPRTVERMGCRIRVLARHIDDQAAFEAWKQDQLRNRRENYTTPLDPLTNNQLRKLINEAKKAPSLRNSIIVKMASTTGANVSEIVGVNRTEVQFLENDRRAMVEYRAVRNGQKRRLNALDQEGSDLMKEYLGSIDERSPVLRSESNARSLDGRITRQGVWLALAQYNDIVGRQVTPRALRDSFLANFEGSTNDLRKAIGVSHSNALELMSRKQHTKLR